MKKTKQMVIIEGAPTRLNMWDRMPGETDKAWDLFLMFREMRPADRKLVTVAGTFGVTPVYVTKTARKYGWWMRAEAWDRHLDVLRQKEFEDETKVMGRRQARLGMKLQDLADKRLTDIVAMPEAMAEITARDAASMAKVGMEMERTARGEQKDVGDERTIIFNFGTMVAAPKWAPGHVKNEPPQLEGEVMNGAGTEAEEGTARATS